MKYILVLLTMTISLGALSQAPDWQVNSSDYEYSMSITGIVSIDTVENSNTNSKLAAWVGNELRGVADPIYVSATGRYYYQLLVYANTSGEVVTFSFYDADKDQIIELDNLESFISDKNTGSFSDPYTFRNWENKTFNSFSFVGYEAVANINASTFQIYITLPEGTDPTSLIAQYQFDHATSVQVNGMEQESGVTANDFTSAVRYDISTGSNIYMWTVNVYIEHTSVTGLLDNSEEELIVYPNPASQSLHIKGLNRKADYQILDAYGKLVLQGRSENMIDIQGLTTGIYFIKTVSSNNEVIIKKWIKE